MKLARARTPISIPKEYTIAEAAATTWNEIGTPTPWLQFAVGAEAGDRVIV